MISTRCIDGKRTSTGITVTADELHGRLFLWTPTGLKIAEQRDNFRVVVPGELVMQQLRAFPYSIDVVEIDLAW